MPTAPSKLFRIADHKFYSPEEIEQIRNLDITYKAQLETIKEFMRQEFYVPATQSGGLPAEFIDAEAKLDRELEEENRLENEKIAKEKQEVLGKIVKELEDKLFEMKLSKEEQVMESSLKVDEYIKKNKSAPDNFVTPENFDDMVSKAMENQMSYEFIITSKGKKKFNVEATKPDSAVA